LLSAACGFLAVACARPPLPHPVKISKPSGVSNQANIYDLGFMIYDGRAEREA
jgi:hypothetical protein